MVINSNQNGNLSENLIKLREMVAHMDERQVTLDDESVRVTLSQLLDLIEKGKEQITPKISKTEKLKCYENIVNGVYEKITNCII